MRLPKPRGPLSVEVVAALKQGRDENGLAGVEVQLPQDVLTDEDFQLSLWVLYELHYRGFEDAPVDREWDPATIDFRGRLEIRFEQELRECTAAAVGTALTGHSDIVEQLCWLVDAMEGRSLASFLQREASAAQIMDFMVQRSLYHLKESDPHSFVLPRIDGRAKAALAELQYDEYGASRPERLHASLFGDALAGCGLDRRYGAYVNRVAGHTLAVNNVMSLFGLHRRLRGAAMGHLAAFEATSSVPCRRIAAGIERVGLPEVASAYFHEHVEADATHEQVALRDICGSLVADEPSIRSDVLFGAAACLYLDAVSASRWLDETQAGRRDGVPANMAAS